MEEIPVNIASLALDPETRMPIVLLAPSDSDVALPIWIGMLEAIAIAYELEGIKPSRPITQDLLKMLLNKLGGKVEKVVITDLREGTYFALIYLNTGSKVIEIDSRPSDAIALALREKCPICVAKKVFEENATPYVKAEDLTAKPLASTQMSPQDADALLQSLDPKKTKMH